jgi:hypothetical protein
MLATSCATAQDDEVRVPAGEPTARPTGDGWIDLLTEENAAKWKNVTDDQTVFTIEDGVMHVLGIEHTQYFAWMGQDFGDFEMHVEFKTTPGANSGVFFRSSPDDPVYAGMEIQVMGDFGTAPHRNGCGSLYDIATPMFNLVRPDGEWNSYDITAKGSQLTVVFNGWKVLDLDLSKMTMPIGKFDTPLAELPQTGHIILQDHGNEVWYRNLVVRPL